MQTWWSAITARHRLEAHRLKLLEAAASAWDRLTAAREQIATQGTTYTDSKGMHQPHPAIGIERDAKTVFARMIRELKLDVEGTKRRPNQTFGVGWRDDL